MMDKADINPDVLNTLTSTAYFREEIPALNDYVIGTVDGEELSYEEWVHPLRMTGGKLALKWEHIDFDHWGYVWWEPTGLVYTFETAPGGQRHEAHSAVNCFKETMQMMREGEETITVVLKDDIDA